MDARPRPFAAVRVALASQRATPRLFFPGGPINTVWTLVAAFLVFGMQAGFTMLGSGGEVITAIGSGDDGKIVAVGQTFAGAQDAFVVVRYTSSGALDPSFGGTGIVTTPIGSTGDTANAVAILPRPGRRDVAGSWRRAGLVMRKAVAWTTFRRAVGESDYSQYVFGMLPLIAMSTRFTQAEPVG